MPALSSVPAQLQFQVAAPDFSMIRRLPLARMLLNNDERLSTATEIGAALRRNMESNL
jgi:hypothetical protein